ALGWTIAGGESFQSKRLFLPGWKSDRGGEMADECCRRQQKLGQMLSKLSHMAEGLRKSTLMATLGADACGGVSQNSTLQYLWYVVALGSPRPWMTPMRC